MATVTVMYLFEENVASASSPKVLKSAFFSFNQERKKNGRSRLVAKSVII
jgi:hypothetical protein